MRPAEVDAGEEDNPKLLPPKKVEVEWLQHSGTKEQKEIMEGHINGYLKDHSLDPLPEESELKIDPRRCIDGAK
jgi:hypothetical protein